MTIVTDPYLDWVAGLLVVSIGLRVLVPPWRVRADVGGCTVAYLRGGERAVVVTALATLHERGTVDVAKRGMVRRAGPLPGNAGAIERAVYAALYQPNGPQRLPGRPEPRRALADLRAELAEAGLLLGTWRWVALRVTLCVALLIVLARLVAGGLHPLTFGVLGGFLVIGLVLWVLPRRTRAGARTLRAVRRRYPLTSLGGSPRDVGMCVGLYGKPALLYGMARFARDGGLLDGGKAYDRGVGDGVIGPSPGSWSGPSTP